ncbi:hypothetical protein Aab01nite_40950 [Paractinoplanes abujensis]|uniref:HTH merR-type domain-containing protein n=1 Tax=Paractinoplanes abujensis TaxID=882441 RepID=A0A7W7G2X1_9ACTN|nr:hypothetical protein [Actinoplanes abujensis]GID20505.1 hypothetical protein Aab01nite_40950 [Actinoplanes abujensis]
MATLLLTIGRLASCAGVTIKAVRVHHGPGLLPEPERDASGYHRYGAGDAIQLVRIRTLARIGELPAAGPEGFAAAIEQIARTRERVAQVTGGDRLFVSPEVAGYLDELRRIGVSERGVGRERELWSLPQPAARTRTGQAARSPEDLPRGPVAAELVAATAAAASPAGARIAEPAR